MKKKTRFCYMNMNFKQKFKTDEVVNMENQMLNQEINEKKTKFLNFDLEMKILNQKAKDIRRVASLNFNSKNITRKHKFLFLAR